MLNMKAAQPHIIFHSFPKEVEAFNQFLDIYYPIKLDIPPDQPVKGLKIPKKRLCRFCKRKYPEVKFKKEAHMIPQSLGNRFLISDFECDRCNESFGKNENDLNNWLGIIRTLSGTKGKKGVPAFKSVSEQVTAKLVNFLSTEGTKVVFKDNSAFSFDEQTGHTKFEFEKGPYTPIKVYKAFLKMAMCFMPESELKDYLPALDFLQGSDDNYGFKIFSRLICHELPMQHQLNRPCGLLFERMNVEAKVPKHFFLLYYEQFIYGFPIPLNLSDLKAGIYKSGDISLTYPPPILFEKPNEQSPFFNHFEEFDDCVRRQSEKCTVSLNTSLPNFEKLVAVDPNTGESTPAEMKDTQVAGLYFVPEGTTIKTGENFFLP
jgi:hypothetical protein